MTKTVEELFKELAHAHFDIEEGLTRVALYSPASDEEVKLIEVNTETLPSGSVVPFMFSPNGDISRVVRIADVTEDEWDAIQKGQIQPPTGWSDKPVDVINRP